MSTQVNKKKGDLEEVFLSLQGLTKEDTFTNLSQNNEITKEDKQLIWAVLFPEPIAHLELPEKIKANREKFMMPTGWLIPNASETAIILEAHKSQQYGRYIRHLGYSFLEESNMPSPIDSDGRFECCVCKKQIFGNQLWEPNAKGKAEYTNKEYLAFCSTESSHLICLNCLTQLKASSDFLDRIDSNRYRPLKLR